MRDCALVCSSLLARKLAQKTLSANWSVNHQQDFQSDPQWGRELENVKVSWLGT